MLMLDCKQASALVSQSLDRKLSLRERWMLKLHLMICDACRRFKTHLANMSLAIKNLTQQIEQDESLTLSNEAKRCIHEAIESHKSV